MMERLQETEGLRVLARIIAAAYLADNERSARGTTKRDEGKKDEGISRTRRNSSDGKRGKQSP